MASTWNRRPDRSKSAASIGEECNHYEVDVHSRRPASDGKRSPLGGRNFEYYSEDPVLDRQDRHARSSRARSRPASAPRSSIIC
ncbi:MAG: hypothetical protein MZU97_24685 [Bacillus subtilis]|nr:hypothetical protein [Bacillus subtilis]